MILYTKFNCPIYCDNNKTMKKVQVQQKYARNKLEIRHLYTRYEVSRSSSSFLYTRFTKPLQNKHPNVLHQFHDICFLEKFLFFIKWSLNHENEVKDMGHIPDMNMSFFSQTFFLTLHKHSATLVQREKSV